MKEKQIYLSDKGIMLICGIILCLVIALAFAKPIKKEEVTVFTREDLKRIIELQQFEDGKESGAEIYACKDKNGNLMVGWDYNNSKQK